jgi:hypothetical protein
MDLLSGYRISGSVKHSGHVLASRNMRETEIYVILSKSLTIDLLFIMKRITYHTKLQFLKLLCPI